MYMNIIFDVGNVLFRYDPYYIITNLLNKDDDLAFYKRHLFDSYLWQSLDRGDLDLDACLSELRKNLSPTATQIDNFKNCITDFYLHLIPIVENIRLFKQLASKFNIYILSNFQDKQFTKLTNLYPFLSDAKGSVISSAHNCKKPEPEIYKVLLKNYNLKAESCIFIDDLYENIKAANNYGILGIHYTSYENLLDDLSKYITVEYNYDIRI